MWFVFNEIPANITASSDGIVIYKYYGKSPVEVEYLNLRDGDYSFLAAKDWLVKLLETTYWPFQKLKANLLFSGRIENLFAQDIRKKKKKNYLLLILHIWPKLLFYSFYQYEIGDQNGEISILVI